MRRLSSLLIPIVIVLASAGCAVNVSVRPPMPSMVRYADPPSGGATLAIEDARVGDDQKMSIGRLRARLVGVEEDPMGFLGRHIEGEMLSRGIDLAHRPEPADLSLRVTTFQSRNHRASGFSPHFTFTKFVGTLDHQGEEHLITAYFKNGKVPVWSFYEVEEPTYTIPFSMLIKEIASKINRIVFEAQSSREEITRIVEAIDADTSQLVYQRVFELGYTNNPEVIPHLRRIATEHEVPLARAAAISSIGILKATSEFDFLREIYESRNKIQRAMALKSIGDLDTPETRAYIRKVALSKDTRDSMVRDIVELYR